MYGPIIHIESFFCLFMIFQRYRVHSRTEGGDLALFLNRVLVDRKSAEIANMYIFTALADKHVHHSLFFSPHSHIPSRMGIKDFPLFVRLYSTFGGICGYSSR